MKVMNGILPYGYSSCLKIVASLELDLKLTIPVNALVQSQEIKQVVAAMNYYKDNLKIGLTIQLG